MRRIGGCTWPVYAEATCQLGGRVFNFARRHQKLIVREIHLQGKAWATELNTHLAVRDGEEGFLRCCALRDSVLVISGDRYVSFAALLRFRGTKLGKDTVSAKQIAVSGQVEMRDGADICKVDDQTIMVFYRYTTTFLYGRVGNDSISFSVVPVYMFDWVRASTPPLLLPDGSLLAPGCNPKSTEIWRVWLSGEGRGEQVGSIPGLPRGSTSTALIAGRFMVGFGGSDEPKGGDSPLSDMWIFDSVTRESSPIVRAGRWHPSDDAVHLSVVGKNLYLIGGFRSRGVYCLPLVSLSRLIQRTKVRFDFQDAIGTRRTYFTLANTLKDRMDDIVVL